jgi:primosomal protein N' (replication factor Y)
LGTGTQRLEQELKRRLPGARILRVDRDTSTGRNFHDELGQAMHAGQVDILVGTQMIAKGLDFPGLTLVAVANADAALAFPDFRAAERSFQLLVQVAGRAGRADKVGEVWVQSRMPDHPCLKAAAAQRFEPFFEAELEERRALAYPPFCRLGALIFRSRDKARALAAAGQAATALREVQSRRKLTDVRILGPAPSPLVQVKGWWRYRLLVKAGRSDILHELLKPLAEGFKASGVLLAVDVDPVSFL